MKRRLMMLTALLGLTWFSAYGQGRSPLPDPPPPPVVMPEPGTLEELGAMGLSGLLGYAWWRVSRSKRRNS
jgi:hypothetical protein